MSKQKRTEVFEPTFDFESAVEESSIAEDAVFRRIDELVGGNTLLAALDGTLSSRLTPEMLSLEDLDLICMTVLVSEETCESQDKVTVVAELVYAMYGVAQYFRFMDCAIESDWIDVFPDLIMPEEIQSLPQQEFVMYVATEAKRKGMNDSELFALTQFLCIGESGTLQ